MLKLSLIPSKAFGLGGLRPWQALEFNYVESLRPRGACGPGEQIPVARSPQSGAPPRGTLRGLWALPSKLGHPKGLRPPGCPGSVKKS